LTDIPPSHRGIPQIEVTFDIDANGIISVSAQDKGTGKEHNIRIESGNKLSEEEIRKMKEEAELNEKSDKEKLAMTQAKNDADSLVFQCEKTISDFGDKISEEEKTELTDLMTKVKESLSTDSLSDIESATKELVDKMQSVSTRVYSEMQNQSPDNMESSSSETEEVEFEEVKG
jgi:molecular chaperone DnaK